MVDCPPAAVLARLGTEMMMEAETLDAVEGHIESCIACQERLQRLAQADAFGEQLTTLLLPGSAETPRIPGFVIERELGRGSTGVVYQALEPNLGRRVALKVVRSGPSAGSHDHARWLREARAFARVRHDNVVRLYQVGEADGWLYMVLELVPGGTLEQRLEVPIAPRDAALLLETIAEAVIAIHREGLIHRDLKPSNILLDAGPETPREHAIPRVGDFGIAIRSDEPDSSLATAPWAGPVGTPSYMAPEQVASDRAKLGPATDVYGLGAILYHLLTGRRPFAAASVIDTLDQVRLQDPVPPRRLNPTVPRDLETICLKCLQKEPARRYESAGAVASDLRRWLDGRSIHARPVSPLETTRRWCRRRPAVAALAVALMIALSGGFLGMFVLWRHAEAERHRAEADHGVALAVLAEVLGFGEKGVFANVVVTRDDLIKSLRAGRSRIIELAGPRSDDPAIWKHLALVDQLLGRNLDLEERLDEALPLHFEALQYWEKIFQNGFRDGSTRNRRWNSLVCIARVLEQRGETSESIRYWELAITAGEDLVPIFVAYEQLAECRLSLARLVARLGDHGRARTILEANVRMLSELGPQALTLGARERLFQSRFRLCGLGQESEEVTAEAWAARTIRLLPPLCRAETVDAASEAEIGRRVGQSLHETASRQRRSGRIDKAGQTIDRLHAFTCLLVERYPDQPSARVARSQSYAQYAKNAWRTGDRVAVERYWNLALEEARHALSLNPQYTLARSEVVSLRRRLEDLLATNPVSPASGRTAPLALLTGS